MALQRGWCLAEGYRNGDQRHLMGPCGSGRTLLFYFMIWYDTICVFVSTSVCVCVWWSGSDDTPGLHSSTGAGKRQERRSAGHGPHTQLPQTTQSASSLRPHERRSSAWVCSSCGSSNRSSSAVGCWAFAVAAAQLWNNLSDNIILSDSLSTFQLQLNIILSSPSYPDVVLTFAQLCYCDTQWS